MELQRDWTRFLGVKYSGKSPKTESFLKINEILLVQPRKKMAEKQNFNIVFIGHVDHGKSTAIGRLLYDSGRLSEPELKKVKDEAEKLGKKGFEFAFVMDKLKEEIKKFEQMLQQIGNVNMRALEVYEDIRKEYEGLLDKVASLQKEKEDVLQMMYEIDSKKKDTFMSN